jgi:hypothetical protein
MNERLIAKTIDGREIPIRRISSAVDAGPFNVTFRGRVETEDGQPLTWVARGHYLLHATSGTIDLFCKDSNAP